LIKAVNLLIADDPRLVFILGMDRDKVAAGLAVKYEKMLPYLPWGDGSASESERKRRSGLEFGDAFLQKFIQLPFRVPDPDLETYLDFIQTSSRPSPRSGAAAAEKGTGPAVGIVPSASSPVPASPESSSTPGAKDQSPAPSPRLGATATQTAV